MDGAEKALDMLKQNKKTGSVNEFCETHNCSFESCDQYHGGARVGWEMACPICDKEKNKRINLFNTSEAAHSTLGLPLRFKECRFNNYKQSLKSGKAFKTCQDYVKDWPCPGGGLMIGGVGTGKTHLATAICQELCDKCVVCKITTVNKIVRDVRSTWGKNSEETERDIINKYSCFDLLVIDEIGSQYGTESERIIVNEIINNRYEMMQPTIVIGNVTLSEAEDILGVRVVDRLKHGGFVLVFDWESYRR